MNRKTYKLLEDYMLSCMQDSAHDKDHIYRVLYVALDIADYEKGIDYDVLITSCLLHDIGREEQFRDPSLCHARIGGQKAYDFLVKNRFDNSFARSVQSCIETHSFRANNPPVSMEAQILFDADKIDATGTLGIARVIFYKGQVSQPLYSLLPNGLPSDGANDSEPSFFQEYKFKLENIYSKFFTQRAVQIALSRQTSAITFYKNMVAEVASTYKTGAEQLKHRISDR